MSENMNVTILFSIIECSISIIAAIISLSLLLLNRETLKEIKKENLRVKHSIESDAISKIVSSQQNILFNILGNENIEVTKALSGFSRDDNIANVYATIYINHFHMIFVFHSKEFLGKDEWIGLQNDIKYSFENITIIKKRWGDIKNTYSTEFQQFVNRLTEEGRYVD